MIGKDEETDLAVLAVDPDGLDLRPLELGDSDSGRSPATASSPIGNPTGFAADRGHRRASSAAGRQIEAPGGYVIDGLLQTDAVIEPGHLGRPADRRWTAA